jgi:hypothetical protein
MTREEAREKEDILRASMKKDCEEIITELGFEKGNLMSGISADADH